MCKKHSLFVVLAVIYISTSFSLAVSVDTFETVSAGTPISDLSGWSAEHDGPLAQVRQIANATDGGAPVSPLDWGQQYLDLSRNGTSGTAHAVYLRQMGNHKGDEISILFDVRFRTLGAVHFTLTDSENYSSSADAGIHFYTNNLIDSNYRIQVSDGGGSSAMGTFRVNTSDWYRLHISADMTNEKPENWTWSLSMATMNSDGTWGDFEAVGGIVGTTPDYGPFAFKNTDMDQVDLFKILVYPDVVNGGGMVLDNFSITPEPTSTLLLCLALPWLRRKRNRLKTQ